MHLHVREDIADAKEFVWRTHRKVSPPLFGPLWPPLYPPRGKKFPGPIFRQGHMRIMWAQICAHIVMWVEFSANVLQRAEISAGRISRQET